MERRWRWRIRLRGGERERPSGPDVPEGPPVVFHIVFGVVVVETVDGGRRGCRPAYRTSFGCRRKGGEEYALALVGDECEDETVK